MEFFNLSSSQKMLLFSQIYKEDNDSFILNFRKDYDINDLNYLKEAVEYLSRKYLNLQLIEDKGEFKQHYVDLDVDIACIETSDDKVEEDINRLLDESFGSIIDVPLYKWTIMKTESKAILIGVVHHILLDGTSLFTIIPQEIEKYITSLKNDEAYVPINYSYDEYVDVEKIYLESEEAADDKKYWLNNLKNYTQDWYSSDSPIFASKEVLLDDIKKPGYSPFITSLALNFLYLSKSKEDNEVFKDIILNTSVHGRYFGQDNALGMFVNTIPLRFEYDEEMTFDELLSYCKGVLKEGLSHAKLQFSELTTDLRNQDIDPDCISMYSIVSNSTDQKSQFLTHQKDISFPLHFRINKNYRDENGLQSIFIEYDKLCFSKDDIDSMSDAIKALSEEISIDSERKCKDYHVDVIDFFKAENYYNNLINSFDAPTTVTPDVNKDEGEYDVISREIDEDKIESLAALYDLSSKRMILSMMLFCLTKFSFSKDILISYDNQACGYHFNTDLSVNDYVKDFNDKFEIYPSYPLLNNKKLDFNSEIVFFDKEYSDRKYRLIFSYENGKIDIRYDDSYYSMDLMSAFMDGLEVLMDKFTSKDLLLKDISIANKPDYDEDFKIKLANEGVINRIFERQVNLEPEKTILYTEDGTFSYRQLNQKANRIANSLIEKGVQVEDRIMFMMRRNSDLIATVLAIVKAGAAFIPIDPKYPKNRIRQILEDSDSKFVITSDDVEYDGENRIDVSELLENDNTSDPKVDLNPDNLCFLIYTSGSTGKPKGVMITHRGISNYIANVEENRPIYQLNHQCSKFISISTVSFIVFLREIFGTILNGLPVVFANDEESVDPVELVRLFEKTDADGFGSTPTRLLEYIEVDEIKDVLGKCKIIIVGGEAFPPVLFDRLTQYTDAEIYNSYGPTEVCIASHYKLMDSPTVTAGWPMLNVVDKIMDIDGNQLPPYVTGEIYVGGAGIARGYLNNQKQTAEVFGKINGIPYYNTGDLGKKDAEGELYVQGRNDTQIKLRGLRIELGEIETAIANYDDITLTKVLVKKINDIEHLCAYYTAKKDIDAAKLKKYLKDILPDYMIPSYFTQLDAFPKTPNGKTDFKNLPEPEIAIKEYKKPITNSEKKVALIVEELLNIDKISVDEDLFSLGLTSLSVIKVSTSIFKNIGVEISVMDIINAKSIENIAKLIEENDEDESIKATEEYYELSPNQLGVYFDCIKNPEKLGYNLPKKIVFDKDIDAYKLKNAIINAIEIHPYLKNKIIIKEGHIYNKRDVDSKIDEIDIEFMDKLNEDSLNDFIRAFDIVDSQLFRFKIVVTPENVILLADFHHIIVDGTALNILFNDIAAFYDDDSSRLIEENADAYEYIYTENKYNSSELAEKSEKFFDEMMFDFDECTLLTTNLNEKEETAKVANIRVNVDKKIVDTLCADKKISPNILFMSSTVLSLTKYVSDKNVLISTIFNGRDNPKFHNTIGMLVKTLPISFKTDRDMAIDDYFGSVNKSWMDVLNNASFNYVEIANKYGLYPDFLYAFHGKIIEDVTIGNKKYIRESMEYDSLRFKVALNILETDEEYVISIDYNDALYSQDYITTYAKSIKRIISQFSQKKDELSTTRIKDIALVDEKEIKLEDIDIHFVQELFEKNVEENKNKTALVCCDEKLTYEQLNKKANRVAHALINRGVEPGSKIIHMLPRTANLIVAMLGIIKTGSAFIPLANDYPEDRVKYIYENSDADWVISENDIENAVTVETLLDESDDESNPEIKIKSDDLAYMIYTSGTTGTPKGVMVTNENVANLFANCQENYVYNLFKKLDTLLSISTVSFDASLIELLGSFLTGRTLIFANDKESSDVFELIELIRKTRPDYMGTTPSRLLQYMEFDGFKELLPNFTIMHVGGEKFPKDLAATLAEYDVMAYNSYGPTETTMESNLTLVKANTRVSVGNGLYNYITDIRDIDCKLLPDGVMGELFIGGKGVTRGYYKNDEKTAESYLQIGGVNYYRSGDYAIKEDDDIYIMGRMDNQIKLRGLRIEPEEISSVMTTYDSIIKAVTVIKKINDIDHLCAYFTADDEVDVDDLKEYMSRKLTDYMIPSVFMQLDKMPQTPNGKTDIRRLPEPSIQIDEYISPRDELEEELWNILSNILGTTSFGVDTDLFTIGLTSLTMMQVVSDIYDKLGTQVMLTELMKNKTIEKIKTLISDEESDYVDKKERYPLTPNQLGVYFECVKKPDDISYNIPIKIEFGDQIDPHRLKSAITTAINNHPYLKTRIVMHEGEVYQERQDNLAIDDYIELTNEEADEDNFVKAFDFDEGVLFRFRICKNTTLLADFHHIILDGTSLNILFDEIASIYDGKTYELEQVDGYEYSLNESKMKDSNIYKDAEKFFFDKVKEFDDTTQVSPDLNGIAEEGKSCELIRYLDKKAINSFCKEHNMTQNNLFLAVTSFVLSKFVYDKNLFIATLSNGRYTKAHEKTLAMMVKTLPLALKLNSSLSVSEYFNYINEEWLNVLTYSSYPLTEISNKFNIAPEFLYTYQGMITENMEIGSKSVRREFIEHNFLKFNMGLQIEDNGDEYKFIYQYNNQLYSEELMNTFIESFNIVLDKFMRLDDITPLKDISITQMGNWTEDDIEYIDIEEDRVNKIFENRVKENKDDVALYACDGTFTFEKLNIKANRIANALIKRGVDVEDKVMIVLKRDSNFIASMFGILKAGAAFIPIDSDYPKDRIEHVLTDSKSKYIITDDIIEIKNIDLSEYQKQLLDINELLEEEDTTNPESNVKGENLAYLIYTSGSTGLPKGVMLEHQNLANFAYPHPDNIYTYELATNYKKEDYKVLSTITVAFDIFLEEVMCSVLNGVPLVLADDKTYKDPKATIELVKKYDANVYTATPSRIIQYLQMKDIEKEMYKFKLYAIAGEPFPKRLYEQLSQNTDAKIFNVYGPTETTISCNTALLESEDITVGKELFNVKEQIMDQDANPLPPNVIGELYIAGQGVSRAYNNRPENNAKAYTTINNIKYYKSGDLAKRSADGQIYVYGRLDNQIKLRGLRIELGEIESAISKYEAIKDVAVVVRKINDNDYLCAYFTVMDEYKKDSPYSIDLDDLKKKLEDKLVYYMIPTFYTEMDEFPRTPNDKIDQKNLPDPEIDLDSYISPRNDTEERLWEIISDILDTSTFGVDTDLFTIGLTSLTTMQLASDIYDEFNVQLMITEIMKNKTIEKIAGLLKEDETEEVDTQEMYPLTANQLGVYFECVKKPDDISYNIAMKMEFGDQIDPHRLKKAIVTAINNHPYLKTRIIMHEGEVYQQRRDNMPVDDYIEVTNDEADEDTFIRAFSLDEGPLFRFRICKNTTLLADFHHIIMDGTSISILFDEIAKIYDGKSYELEQMDGYEYSLNEAKIENSNIYKEAELYFFDKIKEFDEPTIISPDLNDDEGEPIPSDKVSYVRKDKIDAVCKKHKINPNNLFLAVTSFVLSKFVYKKNVLLATPFNGRYTKAQEKTLAMMVKTLPLALQLDTTQSIEEYFNYINEEWINVLTYSSYPLTEISNNYNITPEFIYLYQATIEDKFEIDSKSVKREYIDYNYLKFNMGVRVEDAEEEYKIICQYNAKLYSEELVNTFLESFNITLNKFITYDEKTPLNSISMLEKDSIDKDDIKIEKIPEYRINKIFENCVEENKNDVALYACDGIFTYEQLNAKANRIANALIKLGVGVEDKVMIVLKRNSDFIATMFGILKAGAAFIPIDSDYPKDRIEHVLTDSNSKYIIIDDIVDIKNIDLSAYDEHLLDIEELLKEENTDNPESGVKGSNLAYLIYTSGSTGLPKGVMLEHQNLANFTYPHPDNVYTYELATNYKKEDYRVLSTATVAFDLFLHEAMCAILNGVPIVFANDEEYKDPNRSLELIRKYDVNVYTSTPSRLLQYLDIDEIKDEMFGFKVYSIAGEAFPKRLYDLLREKTDAKLFNVYGPTETTISCNTVELTSDDIHVGKALFNVHEEIMDLDSNPLPNNVIGELYIAGSGVSREYLNRPEKNKESYTIINGVRFYKSGDFAKRADNGNVYIYGRLDNQIKLRGLRIEIGEIESAMSKFDAIKDVAVVVKTIKDNQHLCAYFTVNDEYYDAHRKDDEFSFDIDELKQSLSEKLTYYMVPTVYMQLDEMPQTLNGKTDIKSLPEPILITKYVAPENDVEAFFANTFAEILDLEKVSVTDNFFEIGGTSLLVTKITMAAMNRNYDVHYGDVFKNPTPRQLADFVYNGKSEDTRAESKYDYSQINQLLSKNTLENLINGEIASNLGDILLTGSTGFLGIHVLRELIDSEDGNIYCFVRSRGKLSGEDRLKSLLFYYFSEDFSDLFGKQIHIIEADITSFSDFEKMIPYKIDTLINCAANVKHFSSGTDIEDINLGGVINGLKFAKIKGCKYVQVSTYSVAGLSIDNYPAEDVIYSENDLYIGQSLDNAYLNSKFMAERAILEAAVEDDLDVKIMRVGNLMARSSDSEFQINFESNGFINRLKSFVNIGKMSYEKLSHPVEFSPIDITAKSIVSLARTPKECVVFHPYNNHAVTFADVMEIINDLDLKIEYCEEEAYQDELEKALKDKNRQEALSGIITNVGEGQVKSRWISVKNNYTIQALYRVGVVWPLIEDKYIHDFIMHLMDMDFFS